MSDVVPAVEINIGAPHGREAGAVTQITEADWVAHYVRAIRPTVDCPLIVKLPGQASDIIGMARAATDNGADAATMIGRFNGSVPNVDTWEPELGSGGAIGGHWALPVSLYWISKCHAAMSTPLIGTNGARDGLDIARFMLSGARAVELASLVRRPRIREPASWPIWTLEMAVVGASSPTGAPNYCHQSRESGVIS